MFNSGTALPQTLAFYPSPYVASPAYAAIQTPWYLDYGHLVFWFFFFSTFVIVMWLVYIYVGVSMNIEARRPVRETRGFSRAQVGDTMTAVLPLTWSVTMVAHANTHSSNFDENTTATVFSFSVVAYQWGWNYFFPREILELLQSSTPVSVGHQRSFAAADASNGYDYLRILSLEETLRARASVEGFLASHGKNVLAQPLSVLQTSVISQPGATDLPALQLRNAWLTSAHTNAASGATPMLLVEPGFAATVRLGGGSLVQSSARAFFSGNRGSRLSPLLTGGVSGGADHRFLDGLAKLQTPGLPKPSLDLMSALGTNLWTRQPELAYSWSRGYPYTSLAFLSPNLTSGVAARVTPSQAVGMAQLVWPNEDQSLVNRGGLRIQSTDALALTPNAAAEAALAFKAPVQVQNLVKGALGLETPGESEGAQHEPAAQPQKPRATALAAAWAPQATPILGRDSCLTTSFTAGERSGAQAGDPSLRGTGLGLRLVGGSHSTAESLDTFWLEGVADTYPTRVTDSASADPLHLTTKSRWTTARHLKISTSRLAAWSRRWSWEVLSGGFAWERAYRGNLLRAGNASALVNARGVATTKQLEFLPLFRQGYSKQGATVVLPDFTTYTTRWGLVVTPQARSLQTGAFTPLVDLPAVGLDVDPLFIGKRLTAEVNTSRRTDHDARYRVSWGPVLASAAGASSVSSGPRAWGVGAALSTRQGIGQLLTPHEARSSGAEPRLVEAGWGQGVNPALGLALGISAEVAEPLSAIGLSAEVAPLSSFGEWARSLESVDARGARGYAPLLSDIGSMRRLRVTKGVYLPADLPIHGVFSSKDVIHSWAIPGLCTKIDCIPGYASHRRLLFRWRGLYWGQCMEVCGRYHHWMPILVRVVHKDVFLIWCLTYLRVLSQPKLASSSSSLVLDAKVAWGAMLRQA